MRASAKILFLILLLILTDRSNAEGIRIPDHERHTLENGLTLILLPSDTIPMVGYELWIDVGSTADPVDQQGLAALCAEALRKGAGDRSADEFASAIDFLGANFSTSVDRERTRVALDLLAKDAEQGLSLLADAVMRPRFDADEMDKLRAQMAEEVAQAKENPRSVLADYHAANLHGDHPYGKAVEGTEDSFERMSGPGIREFHAAYYGADRMILAVAGNFELSSMRAMVERQFSSLGAARRALPEIAKTTMATGRRVLLVHKSDTPQTWFVIGNTGPAFADGDFAAVDVVRTIFGGRFTSWLNSELRIKSGLSYGARYNVQRMRDGGSSSMSSFTATENTKAAIDLALATLDRLHEEGIGAEDLASAKAYLKGQTPYGYETAPQLASALCFLEFYGLDESYLSEMFTAVDAVTLEDCRRAVARWFGRENLVFTCIGVAPEVEEILRSYGDLTVRDNDATGFASTPAGEVNR